MILQILINSLIKTHYFINIIHSLIKTHCCCCLRTGQNATVNRGYSSTGRNRCPASWRPRWHTAQRGGTDRPRLGETQRCHVQTICSHPRCPESGRDRTSLPRKNKEQRANTIHTCILSCTIQSLTQRTCSLYPSHG